MIFWKTARFQVLSSSPFERHSGESMVVRLTIACAVLFSVLLAESGCSSQKSPGAWSVLDPTVGDAFYEVNFVSDTVGWVNGQTDRSFERPDEGDEKAKQPPQPKKESDDPLKANQGFEVLRTTDGGQTWSQIPDQFKYKIRSVWFVSPVQGWALTIDRDILSTSDGGASWALQRKAGKIKLKLTGNRRTPELEQPEQIEHLFFLDESHGWAWGGGSHTDYTEQPGIFLVTLNGGANWESAPFVFTQNLDSIFFLDRDNAWASTEGDGLYRSRDGGLSWTRIEGKLPETVLRSIFFLDTNTGWAVGRSGRIAKTTDGGKTWQRMYKIKVEFQMRDIFFTSHSRGWAVGDKGAIIHTRDGGENWISLDSGTTAALIDVMFVGEGSGWIAGLDGALLSFQPASD